MGSPEPVPRKRKIPSQQAKDMQRLRAYSKYYEDPLYRARTRLRTTKYSYLKAMAAGRTHMRALPWHWSAIKVPE